MLKRKLKADMARVQFMMRKDLKEALEKLAAKRSLASGRYVSQNMIFSEAMVKLLNRKDLKEIMKELAAESAAGCRHRGSRVRVQFMIRKDIKEALEKLHRLYGGRGNWD